MDFMVSHEELWPQYAQIMETIVVDPSISDHPYFSPRIAGAAENEKALTVPHEKISYVVPDWVKPTDEIRISLSSVTGHQLSIRAPVNCSVNCGSLMEVSGQLHPIISEMLDSEYLKKMKREAEKIEKRIILKDSFLDNF